MIRTVASPQPRRRVASLGPRTRRGLFLAALLELGFSLFCWTHPAVPILNFHDIRPGAGSNDFWTLSPGTFGDILDRVAAGGFETLSDAELARRLGGLGSYSPSCLLTFDDGFPSHLSLVAGELERRNMQGVFFLTASPIAPGRLDASGAAELVRRGHSVGSHSMTHASLPRRLGEPAGDFRNRLDRELGQSRAILQRWCGRPVDSLAYPLGEVSPEVRDAAGRIGYSLAFTTELGHAQPWHDRLALPRNILFHDATADSVEEYLTAPARWLRIRLAVDLVLLALTAAAALQGARRSGPPAGD